MSDEFVPAAPSACPEGWPTSLVARVPEGYERHPSPASDPALMQLAYRFAGEHPDLKVVVHTSAIWIEQDGEHLGIFTRVILGIGPIVFCVEDGRTPLHIAAADAPDNAVEVTG